METARVVIPSLDGTSSGTGIGYYMRALECARRLKLDLEKQEDNKDDANVGTAFHALQSIYYTRKTSSIVFDARLENDATREASRLLRGYAERFYPVLVGEVVSSEIKFPANAEEAAFLLKLMGFPITGRPDLVITLRNQQDVDRLTAARPSLGEITPGTYLWDFKTKKAKSSNWIQEYDLDWQFTGYPYLYNALHFAFPDHYPGPVKGIVGDFVVRHKELTDASFHALLFQFPSAGKIRGFTNVMRQGYEASLTDTARPVNCFDFGKACHHYTSGRCPRY